MNPMPRVSYSLQKIDNLAFTLQGNTNLPPPPYAGLVGQTYPGGTGWAG